MGFTQENAINRTHSALKRTISYASRRYGNDKIEIDAWYVLRAIRGGNGRIFPNVFRLKKEYGFRASIFKHGPARLFEPGRIQEVYDFKVYRAPLDIEAGTNGNGHDDSSRQKPRGEDDGVGNSFLLGTWRFADIIR